MIATLSSPTLTCPPGATVGCDVRVTNPGTMAATVDIRVDGPAAAWATVLPPTLAVGPGASAVSRVTFDVPRANCLAGTDREFAVIVGDATELAGRVDIGEVCEVRASITPLVARARRATTHTVVVENRGTGRRRLALAASSVDPHLDLRLAEALVVVEAGEVASVALTVRPRRRSLAGASRSRPFAVEARPDDGAPVRAEATHFQDPVRWRAGAVVVALAVTLAGALAAAGAGGRSDAGPALAVPLAAAAPACADRSETSPTQVDIATFGFCPAVVTVPVGTDVRWVNADLAPHTVTYDGPDGTVDSGSLAQGQAWSSRFTRPGTYRYYCRFHPGMAGTVVVA